MMPSIAVAQSAPVAAQAISPNAFVRAGVAG
jgi:hypothetical protein